MTSCFRLGERKNKEVRQAIKIYFMKEGDTNGNIFGTRSARVQLVF
jgi:hypothetical protein